MDGGSLAFVLAISLVVTLLFALAPALLSRTLDLDQSLRAGSKAGTVDRRTRRRMDFLIASEVALAFLLLFGAGLFVSSHSRLQQAPLGFDPHDVLTMRIVPGGNPKSTPEERRLFFGRLFQKAQSLPAVQHAAMAGGLPLDFPAGVSLAHAGAELSSLARVITPDYFRVMGIPLLQGRAFTNGDEHDAPRVAIVNENLAKLMFGDENPVGRRLTLLPGGDSAIPPGSVEIIGLARNTKELGVDEVPFEDVYLPFAQNPMRSMYLVLKTNGGTEGIAASLRQELRGLDADGVVYSVATMDERLRSGLRGARFNLALVAVFAGLAVLLAAVGIYGAVSFSAAQRTREFALRIALGALPRSILALTFTHTARIALAGAAGGLGASLILGRILKSALYMAPHLHPGMIYGVAVNDPGILLGAACIVVGVAAIAGISPAARASRVEPAEALRND
ncbi:membrane hypothetical protein [Candidatus Sulfopaludibacter sp. SbA3]|nr:membrane hypothetical protein [Candidatus Sulfopaludibacter sp. SbA3]